MPNILQICGYYVFFWVNDKQEPIHVHVNKKRAKGKSTKIWLTKAGACLMANNNSRIPAKDLAKIIEAITANHFYICRKWQEYFGQDALKFYC